MSKHNQDWEDIRSAAEQDLWFFARLINPQYLYGDIHKEVFRHMMDDSMPNSLILLPRAHLKALRLDQKVITPNGWIPTGDLKVGDTVYGQDGKTKEIKKLHPISDMELYEVSTETGKKVVCNQEHLWNVVCPSISGDEVLTKPLKDIIKDYKETKYLIPNIEPVELPEKDLPIDPYVLGCQLDNIPSDYLLGSIDQRKALLKGLMDTSGTGSTFNSSNKNLIDSVIDIVRSLGGIATTDKSDSVEIKLQGDLKEAIVSIRKVESAPARCISVEGELFITEGYTLTHNSHIIAVWCAWWITKHPETTIMYLSATTSLAEDQLYAIKNMLTSDNYSFYWPDMVDSDEGKRETWTKKQIAVDHPTRKKEGIRDMTIVAAGLTTGTTGKHADIIVPDDVVVPGNAYTEEGRRQVAAAMSQMSSILNTGGMVKACGTRYHPNDQYALWKEMTMPTFDDDGYEVGKEPIWNIFERVVEKQGVFLWPRAVREDGKAFGFDRRELARISAMYTDRTQFHAQYYNDPNDPESNRLSQNSFQYYERGFVKQESGSWYFKDRKLNIYAAIDFAYTINDKSDYTAIIVIGIDYENNIYVLDIDRFKTNKIQEYYDRLMALYFKWEFRKLRAEITAAQSIIVNDLKDRVRRAGTYITIDGHRPTAKQGSKQERIAAVLEPRYEQGIMYHYKGGFTPALEEELVLARPKHDDLKDCLAAVVETATPPRGRAKYKKKDTQHRPTSRFGG